MSRQYFRTKSWVMFNLEDEVIFKKIYLMEVGMDETVTKLSLLWPSLILPLFLILISGMNLVKV